MKYYILISLKGLAMGMADIVPGVSGGTIALITGIYEELITNINRINLSLFKRFRKDGLLATWAYINGNFFLALGSGIALSVISMSRLLTYLLEYYPQYLWAFFFGLILASVFSCKKMVSTWNLVNILGFAVSAIISFWITTLEYGNETGSFLYLFFCGMIAIIAMILPGISGAFILLLLGSYKTIITAVHHSTEGLISANWTLLTDAFQIIGAVAIGAIIGLKLFSKILAWMFTHHKDLMLSCLIGFMIGSLNKIWPWKETISTLKIGDKIIPKNANIMPFEVFSTIEILYSFGLMILGFLLVYLLEKKSLTSTTPV